MTTDTAARQAIRAQDVEPRPGSERPDFGQENWDLWWAYAHDERRMEWEAGADEDEGFYFGRQFDTDEEALILQRGQVAAVINRIRPLIRQFVAEVTASLPAFTFLAGTREDSNRSWIFAEYITWSMYKYFFPKELEQAAKDMIRIGLGWLFVDYVGDLDDLRGDAIITRLDRKEVFADPDAKKWDFSDARNMIVTRVFPVETVIARWPQKAEQIKSCIGRNLQHVVDQRQKNEASLLTDSESLVLGQDWQDRARGMVRVDRVRVIERYTRRPVPVIVAFETETGKQLEFVDQRKFERYMAGKARGAVESVTLTVPRIIRITSVLDQYLEGEILPISAYPTIPMVMDDADNPFPVGEVRHLKDCQRLINKCFAVMVYAAQVTGNAKVLFEKGALGQQQREDVEQEASKPGAWIEVENLQKVETVFGQQLPAAFAQLLQFLMAHLEYEVGIFSLSQGDPSQAPRTAQATREIKQYGGEKISLVLRGMDMSLTRVGQTFLEFVQANLREEKVVRVVTEGDGRQDRLTMLQQSGLVDETGVFAINQRPGEGDLMLPDGNSFLEATNEGGIVRRYINDVSVGKYDVRVVPQSYRASNRLARLELLRGLHQEGVVDGIAVLDEVDLKDKDLIKARMDAQQQLAAQLQGAVQTIETLETQVQRMTGQLTGTKVRAEVTKAQAQLRTLLAEVKTELKGMTFREQSKADRLLLRAEQQMQTMSAPMPSNGQSALAAGVPATPAETA